MDMTDVAASVKSIKSSVEKSDIIIGKQEALQNYEGPSLTFKIYGIKVIAGKKMKLFLRDEFVPAKLYPWDVILIDVHEMAPYDKIVIEKADDK